MSISFNEFKKITKHFQAIAKNIAQGNIDIRASYDTRYTAVHNVSFTQLTFKTIAKMHAVGRLYAIPLNGLSGTAGNADFWHELKSVTTSQSNATLQSIQGDFAKDFTSLKIIPEELEQTHRPYIIRNAPVEVTEGNYTYRFLTRVSPDSYHTEIALIVRNDEPLYDFLDKGFYIAGSTRGLNSAVSTLTPAGKLNARWLVSNEYNVNTAHIFAMFKAQPQLAQMCKNSCFVQSREAELVRLKMQKKLSKTAKLDYDKHSPAIENDYKKNTTLVVVGKLMNDEIAKTTINNILLTKTSATYERISIEADDLLEVLYRELNFNGEFDIYTISEMYSQSTLRKLDVEAKKVGPDNPAVPDAAENVEDEKAPKTELPSFTVNGIRITPAVSATKQRYINNVRINKEEIAKAIHRASCHHGQDEYKLFLKSISKMSIKWHDIIANGLQVKIHDMSREDYGDPVPKPNAPAMKFVIDKKEHCVKIKVDETRVVRVALGRLIKRVDTLNKRTDNRAYNPKNALGFYQPTRWRNATWAAEELVTILLECCTFKNKVKNAEGVETEETQVLITRDDIVKLLDVANAAKKAAIERSKQFLDTAIKMTGAEHVQFMDTPAYKVTGSLRTYAVVIKNAKVYDFETKQYRCIVNDRHYAGAGYDDIAARLLALKNDNVMQEKIGTLRGAAQPAAENIHNDYVPDRENFHNTVVEVVDRALATK